MQKLHGLMSTENRWTNDRCRKFMHICVYFPVFCKACKSEAKMLQSAAYNSNFIAGSVFCQEFWISPKNFSKSAKYLKKQNNFRIAFRRNDFSARDRAKTKIAVFSYFLCRFYRCKAQNRVKKTRIQMEYTCFFSVFAPFNCIFIKRRASKARAPPFSFLYNKKAFPFGNAFFTVLS